MNNPDARLYELEVGRCDDGDILLSQGHDDCGDEIMVRLHRCHLDLLAELSGFVSEDEAARRCERLTDRLNLMAALIHSQTAEGDPLRAAVAAIVPDARPTYHRDRCAAPEPEKRVWPCIGRRGRAISSEPPRMTSADAACQKLHAEVTPAKLFSEPRRPQHQLPRPEAAR